MSDKKILFSLEPLPRASLSVPPNNPITHQQQTTNQPLPNALETVSNAMGYSQPVGTGLASAAPMEDQQSSLKRTHNKSYESHTPPANPVNVRAKKIAKRRSAQDIMKRVESPLPPGIAVPKSAKEYLQQAAEALAEQLEDMHTS